MALPIIEGNTTNYSINDEHYPLGVTRLIVRGTGVGLAIGATIISNPIPDHFWGYGTLQEAIDGLATIVNTGVKP